MWKGKGRSGIGDTNIQGTWEDFDGLSPNGRQYKNAITQECRNLSGSDYWFARKADYPKQEPETWVNGKANVNAFRDTPSKPPTKPKAKRSAFQLACLSDNNYERLQRISESLDDDLESGVLSVDDWQYAKKNLQPRLDRAWKKIAQNRGWDEDEQEIEESYQPIQTNTEHSWVKRFTKDIEPSNLIFNELREDNVFRIAYLVIKRIRGFFK